MRLMDIHHFTVPEILKQALSTQHTRFSLEIIPPSKGNALSELFKSLAPLAELGPAFINVTHHPEERRFISSQGQLLEKVITKRPGTVGICAALKQRYPAIQPVAHIICMGMSIDRIEDALIELNYLGIRNLIALRGDLPQHSGTLPVNSPAAPQHKPVPHAPQHQYAVELVKQIHNLNKGIYLDPELSTTTPTRFSIGVAGYPEGHAEALSAEKDIFYLKQKLAAGGEYVVTQMFFDNRDYFNFCARARAAGITAPILPGLKPIATQRHLSILPERFGISIPAELAKELKKATTPAAVRAIGTEWCITQCLELKAHGVPMLHFYTMNRNNNIAEILKRVF